MLIFVNMKIDVERLARRLKANGLPAEGITGDLPQRQRFKLMERFKNGQIKILLATDVASRGIHVEDISHVINYDLPQDAENYVHRIGRTARAGKTGKAISLACEEYVAPPRAHRDDAGLQDPGGLARGGLVRRGPFARRGPERRRSGPVGAAAERGGERRDRPSGAPGAGTGRTAAARDRTAGGAAGHATEAPKKPKAKRIPGAFFGFGPARSRRSPRSETAVEKLRSALRSKPRPPAPAKRPEARRVEPSRPSAPRNAAGAAARSAASRARSGGQRQPPESADRARQPPSSARSPGPPADSPGPGSCNRHAPAGAIDSHRLNSLSCRPWDTCSTSTRPCAYEKWMQQAGKPAGFRDGDPAAARACCSREPASPSSTSAAARASCLTAFLDMGLKVTGIDPSTYMLDIALSKAGNRVGPLPGVRRRPALRRQLLQPRLPLHHAWSSWTTRGKALAEACRVAKDRLVHRRA
ncbi:MAG: hypothetical protein MZV70_03030 [Desulfobacterales bacterium]|nr:hypothetical protein [Desulfobacterales bacterium]